MKNNIKKHIEYPKKKMGLLREVVVGNIQDVTNFFSFVKKERFDLDGNENEYYEMNNDNILSIENSIKFAAKRKHKDFLDTVHFWERNDESPNNPKQCVKYIKITP